MASHSLSICGVVGIGIPKSHFQSRLVLSTSHRHRFAFLPRPPTFRFQYRDTLKPLQTRQESFKAFASNQNAAEDSLQQKSDAAGEQGPPILTIMAGLLVFVIFSWAVFSSVSWLFGLLLKYFSSK